MNKQAQFKPKTTLGGFPFTPSKKRDLTHNAFSHNDNSSDEPVISEEELLQYWGI